MLINACSGFICSGAFQIFSVENIDRLLAFRKVDNGLGCFNRHFHFTFTGEGGGMRCHQHIVQLEQQVAWLWRLLFKHVQSGTTNAFALQRLGQCGFVDDRASGGVDDEGTGFHQIKSPCIHEMMCFFRVRDMDGNEVGSPEYLINLGAETDFIG